MLDPNEILKLSEGSERVASELQEDIIKAICERIAIRLGRGDDYILTPRDKWQLDVLKDAGFLVDDLAKIIAKKTGRTVKEMRKAFAAAGVSSTKFDDITYLQAGIPVVPIQQSPAMIRLLERGMNKTFQEWKNYTGTTLQECADQFIRECDRAYTAVLSGSVGYGEAVKNALKNITETGGKVVYPSGHEDTLEVATYRAVRTGISQAASDITSVRAAENGITLFITSSHLGARPTHEPWQGKVFWVDWDKLSLALGIEYDNPKEASVAEKAKYDEFVATTEIGTVTGLCGANCRHSYGPYIEGISHNPYEQFDSEENQKRYEIEQEQRAWERKIRKQKRKVEGLKAGLDKEDPSRALETTEKLRKEEKKLAQMRKDYKAFSTEHKLKEQPHRLEIADNKTRTETDPVLLFKSKHRYIEGDYQANYNEAKKAVADIPKGFNKSAPQAYNLMRYEAGENCPTIVDNLDSMEGPMLYRGVKATSEIDTNKIIANTKYDKYPYVGKGQVGGGGLYFTTSLETASQQYGDNVITGKLLPCKTISLDNLRKMAAQELGFANMPYSEDLSIYALEKGYDVIWTRRTVMKISQIYINVLNRKVIAIQK